MSWEEDSDLRVAIAAPHLSMTMLEVYKGLGSTGKLLLSALYAKSWTSMKVPVGIDLRRASFILYQTEKRIIFVENGGLGSGFGVGRSSGPITPFQIIVRASAARGNRD